MKKFWSFALLFTLFFLFDACSDNSSEANSYNPANRDDSDSSFGAFLSQFQLIEAPYAFTDEWNTWQDSLGNSHYRSLRASLIRNWLHDSAYHGGGSEMLSQVNNELFYEETDSLLDWASVIPFIRIKDHNKEVVFLSTHFRESMSSWGYAQMWAITYSQEGAVLKIDSIGRYGASAQKESDYEGKRIYWQESINIIDLKINILSLERVEITSAERIQTELAEEIPRDTHYTTVFDKGSQTMVKSLK